MRGIGVLLMLGIGVPVGWAQEQVFLTPEEALAEVFPEGRYVQRDTLRFSPAALQQAQHALRRSEPLDSVLVVMRVYDASGKLLGYAVITEEVGKYRPITFIVGVRPDFSVEKVAVMVYRESHGGQVRLPRFLYQYRGKTIRDPIQTHRDIVNVSGATISVHALNRGVKKVLYFVTSYYQKHPPALTYHPN
ncbi:FMN-binding protein [Rhodothermus profundi]|uniref:Na+-translocating ferredoxin:NAD+ oxidoreductase RNF, RnfG subunit n=1 Tax=Rhodothermus profundi TaxID=633813 RepID=A0A1M6WNV1_9BACT|nr:FMN-binding protein [Rhodothermus profundi]SHK95269.1 Na+-translocating ferredoxin:NAD+ oxidoreductase RNF, RnfG subunit [Rhodothermus profundi]